MKIWLRHRLLRVDVVRVGEIDFDDHYGLLTTYATIYDPRSRTSTSTNVGCVSLYLTITTTIN